MTTLWTANATGDLTAAIECFHAKLPGWWFSVGICHVSADATVCPDSAGCDADLLRVSDAVHGALFDGGFDVDLLPPATMADALRMATIIGLLARNAYRSTGRLSDVAAAIQYDARADLAGSINLGFEVIRDRVANGGPGWERGK